MEDNVGRYLILNSVIVESEKANDIDSDGAIMVYEVIRVINGVPLFLEDHYSRMNESLSAVGHNRTINYSELANNITSLAEMNNTTNFNVKLISYIKNGKQSNIGYISRSYYPTMEQIDSGVRVDLFHRERKDPNIKLVNQEYKNAVADMKNERNLFEVLLVNENGIITEGGASNVFFVKDKIVFTAPGESVLKGITRKYIIEACKNVNYEVMERFISIDELNEIEGLFISGTSIKVLPVSNVGNIRYNSAKHPVIVKIRGAYDELIRDYIEEHANGM